LSTISLILLILAWFFFVGWVGVITVIQTAVKAHDFHHQTKHQIEIPMWPLYAALPLAILGVIVR
jgi:TRAP-type C4-dicarboxylate transport system permease small subunit